MVTKLEQSQSVGRRQLRRVDICRWHSNRAVALMGQMSRRAGRLWSSRVAVSFALGILALSTSLPYAHAGHPSETYAGQQIAQTGFATYYASHFEGRRTASGTTFRNHALVAAHPSLPFGTLARVTNLVKGNSVIVRITDRGPASGPRSKGVIIDLSQQAARQLNMISRGRVRVAVEVLAATKNRHSMQSAIRSTRKGVKSPSMAFADNLALRMDTTLVLAAESAHAAASTCTACSHTVTPPPHNHVQLANADSER